MAGDPIALVYELAEHLKAKNRAKSAAVVHKLIDLAPPLKARWKSMAAVAKKNGEYDDANRAMDLYARDMEMSDTMRYELAAVRAQTGRLEEALALMDKVPGSIPSEAENAYIRGTIATNMGQFDEARIYLRRAVQSNPTSGQTWLALAMAGTVDPADAARIIAAKKNMDEAPAEERTAYFYALGKVYDEADDHDRAFAAFDRGAGLKHASVDYSMARHQKMAEAAMEGWSAEAIDRALLSVDKNTPRRPLFVTGLPRSGTTLVEQILASHTMVDGGEELALIRFLEQDIGGKTYRHYSDYISKGNSAAGLRALYEHLLIQRYPGTGLIVDKSLNASRNMGIMAALFPDSPIIWMRRDPIDCAWSIYRTLFLSGLDWSYKLEDIAAFFNMEDKLHAYWTETLGERILTVNYSDLVRSPDSQIRKIVSHCRLEIEPDQLKPHELKRKVVTASVVQVRKPINTKSLGSAAPYLDKLHRFTDNYFS